MILGGPSLASTPLELLNGRGITTLGVNNSWLMHRPDLWVCVDHPGRFSSAGWFDPGITKLLPLCHTRAAVRQWEGDQLVATGQTPRTCPATLFFRRNDDFDPRTYWTDMTVQWGTLKGHTDAVGVKNSRSVMIGIFRLAHWLGFNRVYLVGADFRMSQDPSVSPYAWKEGKDEKGRRANNSLYQSLNRRFMELRSRGMPIEVFNCTPGSGLVAFPHMDLREALEREGDPCRVGRTDGWYTK